MSATNNIRSWAGKNALLNRLHAWWEGMDADEDGPVAADATDANGEVNGGQEEQTAQEAGWPAARLAAAQRLFGEGYTFPGGEQVIAHQIEPLTVEKSMNVLDIGAGIGVATRIIAQKTEAKVDGLEMDPAQVELAKQISEKAGLGDLAAVLEGGLGNCGFEPETRDVIYGREVLLGLKDKETAYQEIWSLLKPGGEVLLADFAAKNAGAAKEDAAEWAKFEKMKPRLATVDQIKRGLTASFLDVHQAENISKVFCGQILQGLASVAKNLKQDSLPKEQRPWVMWEVELWARRASMLQAGNIGFYRFHASKANDG